MQGQLNVKRKFSLYDPDIGAVRLSPLLRLRSGQALLTLDRYPTSSAMYAQGQQCSPKNKETPGQYTVTFNPLRGWICFNSKDLLSEGEYGSLFPHIPLGGGSISRQERQSR